MVIDHPFGLVTEARSQRISVEQMCSECATAVFKPDNFPFCRM
ncbi:hypothetical protein F4557_007272 [Actinomadura catellatispora]|uniref:Uncharacterized protein n=1 Tax=Actinomadura livida TaxID=79909 RepID=A0A7W7IKM4_9ACTN|nr:hypothetical protein [Actinomadura catellatispora]